MMVLSYVIYLRVDSIRIIRNMASKTIADGIPGVSSLAL
jgi:hypothetical protein